MYKTVKVRVGYNRYKFEKRLFCDQCGQEVHWVVPQKDITSTLHICEICDSKNKELLNKVND